RPAHHAARRRVGRPPPPGAPRAVCRRWARRKEGEGRMTMLRVRDITVRFGGIVALDEVSLDLNRGEILGLIGPNGAGKTTLFNCISGVIAPDKGTIFFEGHSLVYAPPHVRARFGSARAMRPRLRLLDGPAAGLDAQETARLAELLHAVRERFHVSMLLVDHDMSLVMRVCDYVYVLDFGKLLARGQPAAIRGDPKVVA